MKSLVLAVAALGAACGDNRAGDPDAALPFLEASVDSFIGGTLFGEPCLQPPFPEIGTCHLGEGACNDEAGGPVCRPWCHVEGVAQCMARQGVEHITDRGACVCVPPPG
jgi:hypothetical protein